VPLKQYKATSPVRRFRQSASFEELTKGKARERSLTERKLQHAGRNAQGRVTTRHRGGGEKRSYRKIDFKRDKDGVPARVLAIGNNLPLENIPTGTQIHGVELQPGRGAQLVRAAGTAAQLVAKEGEYAQIRLPSGGIRVVHIRCRATIGQIGNVEHENQKVGGAGHKRHMGWRPAVRGVVMSPRDHPHGGGEAKSPVGGMAQTPWGKPAMGLKTRNNPRTDRFVTERPKKRKSK